MAVGRLQAGEYGGEGDRARAGLRGVVASRRPSPSARALRLRRPWLVSTWALLAICGLPGCARTALWQDQNEAGTSGAAPIGGFGAAAGASAMTTGGASETAGAGAVDPCAGVRCDNPPPSVCASATSATTYAPIGKCRDGACSYMPITTRCGRHEACAGAGVCSATCTADSRCGAGCLSCGGDTPKCKDLGATSRCVGCLSDADCTEALPTCNTTTNVCGPPPSCIGLPWTCGPHGDANCCASSVVTGGTFNRSNDPNYPATVSDFRLDTYEISVGRFRNFWKGYPTNMPTAGSGKNPNNPRDRGWDAAWNASALPATQAQLTTNIIGFWPGYQTWQAGDDALPINCIDWYEAQAFCIWDGGRLPTEAEWNYAAAGGSAQRPYPWGSAPPDCSYANVYGAADGSVCAAPGAGRANRVGSESPKGDGLFGQADLSGNVWEWTQDWYADPYPNPCNNCAGDAVAFGRALRGGSFYFRDASSLLSSYRSYPEPTDRDFDIGARCARAR